MESKLMKTGAGRQPIADSRREVEAVGQGFSLAFPITTPITQLDLNLREV